MKRYLLLLLIIFSYINVFAQSNTIHQNDFEEIKGKVLDADTQLPLAFTNIGILSKNRGTVSNEEGKYLLNIIGLQLSDTVSFNYMGYKAVKISISDLVHAPVVQLSENVISISDFVVYGNDIDAKAIVKKVLENKERNYKPSLQKSRMFIRNRYATDMLKLKVKPLKNTFDQLDENTARLIERSVPKKQLSYTDYYGDVYSTNNKDIDKGERIKLSPIKIISLKDNVDYSEIENTFGNLFKDTKDDEYWKVASGIFSTKANFENDSSKIDSTYSIEEYKNTMNSWFFTEQINRSNRFLSMNSDESWEFLYDTGKYNYTMFGGTRIKGEDVYIIDFEAKRRGDFKGRLYISCSTFAILKADYQFAEGKLGTDVNMFGISYKETIQKITLFYENHDGIYKLKYFFRQEGELVGVSRKVELIKKRERFLLDKTIARYKVHLEIKARNLNSIEILVIDDIVISEQEFAGFKSKKRLKVKHVNIFDDKMWQGYSIIAPTEQMKDYRKR